MKSRKNFRVKQNDVKIVDIAQTVHSQLVKYSNTVAYYPELSGLCAIGSGILLYELQKNGIDDFVFVMGPEHAYLLKMDTNICNFYENVNNKNNILLDVTCSQFGISGNYSFGIYDKHSKYKNNRYYLTAMIEHFTKKLEEITNKQKRFGWPQEQILSIKLMKKIMSL